MGVGAFAAEVQSELLEQGFNVYSDAVLRKKYAEAQMSSDSVLLCLSAITLKFDLPSAGRCVSRSLLTCAKSFLTYA